MRRRKIAWATRRVRRQLYLSTASKASRWKAKPQDDSRNFNESFDDDSVSMTAVAQDTATRNDQLVALAEKSPPPEEWYEGDEEKPF